MDFDFGDFLELTGLDGIDMFDDDGSVDFGEILGLDRFDDLMNEGIGGILGFDALADLFNNNDIGSNDAEIPGLDPLGNSVYDSEYDDIDMDEPLVVSVDTDGDDIDDTSIFMHEFDIDGDGEADALFEGVDIGNDGVFDFASVTADSDGDGIEDAFIDLVGFDMESGTIESATITADSNGDEIDDTMISIGGINIEDQTIQSISFATDDDGDGSYDSISSIIDLEGDGVFETQIEVSGIDADTGVAETVRIQSDIDGNGLEEVITITGMDMETGDFDSISIIENGVDLLDDTAVYNWDTYENFDPDNYDPEYIIGSPVESMEHWHRQQTDNTCGIASQQFILETVTGETFDELELRDIAEANGWFGNGTSAYDIGNLLVAYGMEVTNSFDNDMDDLREALENGGYVIVGVDSSELWFGDNDDIYAPGSGADHAIQVIGIDESDPDNPMVIINDPGDPDGCGGMVAADDFAEAWDGGFMSVAYSNT